MYDIARKTLIYSFLSDLPPPCHIKVMEQSPLISENGTLPLNLEFSVWKLNAQGFSKIVLILVI